VRTQTLDAAHYRRICFPRGTWRPRRKRGPDKAHFFITRTSMLSLLLFSLAAATPAITILLDSGVLTAPLDLGMAAASFETDWTFACAQPTPCHVHYANHAHPMITLEGHHARSVTMRGMFLSAEGGDAPLVLLVDVHNITLEGVIFEDTPHRTPALFAASSGAGDLDVLLSGVHFHNCSNDIDVYISTPEDALDITLRNVSTDDAHEEDIALMGCCRGVLDVHSVSAGVRIVAHTPNVPVTCSVIDAPRLMSNVQCGEEGIPLLVAREEEEEVPLPPILAEEGEGKLPAPLILADEGEDGCETTGKGAMPE